MAVERFSSRTQALGDVLSQRLLRAKRYLRIAGYFRSSLLEVVGEALETVEEVRVVCNGDLDPHDVKVARAAAYAKLDPDSRQAAMKALETGRPLPYDAPLWGEVRPMWENELPRLWRGETTARDLMQRIVPLVNDRLKNAPK